MPYQIGWWTFDAETQTLINRVSDQRIRFEGAADDAGSLLHRSASGLRDCAFRTRTPKLAIPCS